MVGNTKYIVVLVAISEIGSYSKISEHNRYSQVQAYLFCGRLNIREGRHSLTS